MTLLLVLARLRVEHLYAIEALAIVGFFAALWPLWPHDFWWHLKIGQVITEEGRIPDTNMFAWSLAPDTPFFYGAWLGEWLLYQLYRLGGLEFIVLARNALAVGAFSLVALEARRRSGSWRLAGLVVALGAVMSAENLVVRPQMWVWPLFALNCVVLSRYAAGRLPPWALIGVVPVVGVWTNVHGSFMLGLVLIGMFALGESISTVLRQTGALTWRKLAWLYGASGLTVLATLANPRGVGVIAYVQDLLTDQPSQRLIAEWQPPTPSGITNVAFFASILFLLAALAYARRRPTPTSLIVLCGFLWLAWNGERYIIWYAMAAMPFLAELLGAGRRDGVSGSPAEPVRKPELTNYAAWRIVALNWAIVVFLTLPVLALQPWSPYSVPLSQMFGREPLSTGPPAISSATPMTATEFLRENPGGSLFNEMGYGSYLIWALPKQPVFIDPRVELYPIEHWLDYIEISNGHQSLDRLARYGADRVLLSRLEQPGLSSALAASASWQREYIDGLSEVWRYSP